MTSKIDAMGKACPMPVILAKQAIDGGARDLTISVDNEMAVQNLQRLATSQGLRVQTVSIPGGFAVQMMGGEVQPEAAGTAGQMAAPKEGEVFFIGKDHIGDGAEELGQSLMKMFLYTLAQREATPEAILFMNGGVRLPTGEPQVIESLQALERRGCEILVCGTCLNYYGLAEARKIGAVSNMYDIVERMCAAKKVITV